MTVNADINECTDTDRRDMEQEIARLRKINSALIDYVERSTNQHGNAYSLFQTAISLEGQVRRRTEELTQTLSSLEESNRELNSAKDLAETANQSKTRFLAAASHDLLQPVNAAHLLMAALAELQQTDDTRTLAARVQQSLDTIDDLLRTILDISRLDAGVMQPKLEALHLDEIFRSLESDFIEMANRRALKLRIVPTAFCVESDRTMLRRVLQNIISNAIRYTDDGGVLVGARKRGDNIRIDVVDTGTGIDEEYYEEIFEEFRRGLPSQTGSEDHSVGLGLGLTIVKRMTETLRHPLSFSSVPGKGSWFRLTLPAAIRPCDNPQLRRLHQSAGASRIQGVHGACILLIENDTQLLEAMRVQLEKWHCAVEPSTQAGRVEEILADGKFSPDVIIADQHLDHGELGSAIIGKVRETLQQEVPAIIITADFSSELKSLTAKQQIRLINKPVKPAHLRALLAHVLSGN